MPPILQAVAQAYRDLTRCIHELRALVVVVLLITLAFQAAETLLLPPAAGETSRTILLRFVSSLAQGFLTVPYYIAVHRLVILGERTNSYAFAPSSLRFQQFFWWWAALSVVTYLPISLVEILGQARGLTASSSLVALAAMPVILIAIIIVTLRLTIIFPAVAVDAPGATWQNVMADTKGYAWRIFLFGLVATLPLVLPALLLVAMADVGDPARPWLAPGGLSVIFSSVLSVVALTLFIVVASRLYLWIGNRTKQP
jgi:hypothetical protein